MFSWLRARSGVFATGRHPLRVNAQIRRGEIEHLQPVRFKKPSPFRTRRVLAIAGAAIGCHLVYQSLVFVPLARFHDDLEKNLDAETRKALEKAIEEDTGSWFIPFPGTEKRLKPSPYRGSDPEWKEYIKFSKNPQLGKRVREDLAESVRASCARDPQLNMKLGKTMKIKRYWLDVDFPMAPPPSYERSGIEITDEYVAWTTMPVDSLTVSRIRQALWPSAFAQSSVAFVKVLFGQNLTRVGTVFGWEPKPQPTFEELVALKKRRPTTTPAGGGGMSTVATTRTPDPSGAPKQPEMLSANTSTSKKSIEAEEVRPIADVVKPSFSVVQGHMASASKAFKAKFGSVWQMPMEDPPRGSILVSGLVELEAPRAWLVIDVRAFWDPKTKTYDSRSVRFVLRRFQPKRQSPMGGK